MISRRSLHNLASQRQQEICVLAQIRGQASNCFFRRRRYLAPFDLAEISRLNHPSVRGSPHRVTAVHLVVLFAKLPDIVAKRYFPRTIVVTLST